MRVFADADEGVALSASWTPQALEGPLAGGLVFQLDSVLPDRRGRSGRLGDNLVGVWRNVVLDRRSDFLTLLDIVDAGPREKACAAIRNVQK